MTDVGQSTGMMDVVQLDQGFLVQRHTLQTANEVVAVQLGILLLEQAIQLTDVDRVRAKVVIDLLHDDVAVEHDGEVVLVVEFENELVLSSIVDHRRIVQKDLQAFSFICTGMCP